MFPGAPRLGPCPWEISSAPGDFTRLTQIQLSQAGSGGPFRSTFLRTSWPSVGGLPPAHSQCPCGRAPSSRSLCRSWQPPRAHCVTLLGITPELSPLCIQLLKSSYLTSNVSPFLLPNLASFKACAMGFPGGSDGKESACNAGDQGSIPGLGRFPG